MDLIEANERGFDPGVRHPWEVARVDVVKKLIDRQAALEPGAIVMDIGCGDTFVVEQLAAAHENVSFYAVDTAFTDELLAHYRALLNPRIQAFQSLDAMPSLPRPAALVLLMDVIEHVEDDKGFLTGLRKRPCIGPDTRFLITVPSYQALFCSHDSFLGHYRRYSNRMLKAHVEAAGLRVIDSGYFFSSLLPVRALQVLKERLAGAEPEKASTGLVGWDGGPQKAAILRKVLGWDAAVSMVLGRAGIRLAGLSNYAICAVVGASSRQRPTA